MEQFKRNIVKNGKNQKTKKQSFRKKKCKKKEMTASRVEYISLKNVIQK